MKNILHFLCICLLCAATTTAHAQSGSLGNGLEWVISSGTLTIKKTGTGTGVMPDYTSETQQPWYSYRNSLTDLVIENGVTSIGNYAFSGCRAFTESLTLPESVTSIGEGAFFGCYGFTGSLIIPERVTSIGEGAFLECSGFTGSLTLPEVLTSIGNGAFYDCNGFTGSLTLPEGLTSLGLQAFAYCNGFTGSLTIPEGVTSIGEMAFQNCYGFNGSLTLPENVTSIGEGAFSGCYGFTGSLTIPAGVTSIENEAFRDCRGFNGSLTIPEGVTSIGEGAFQDCSGFTGSLTIPAGVTNIGDYVFTDCRGFNGSLTIPAGVTSIGTSFNGCSGFTGSLTIPESVTSIGEGAFDGCSGFTGSLTIPAGVTSIGPSAFNGCSGFTGSLTIPESVTSIGSSAFNGCSGFTGSLTIPVGVTSIDNIAFQNCSGFTGSLTISEGVSSIGRGAFNGCSSFTGNLTIPAGVTNIGERAFQNCIGFTGSLTIPAGVTSIDSYAFSYCSGFTGSLTIPEGITSISEYAFIGCNGFTGNLTIPAGVTSIGNYAFAYCSGFTGSLTIPAGLTSIGSYAFRNCNGLTSLNFNATNCITISAVPVFSGCSNLATLLIGDNVQSIPSYAFSDCSEFTGSLTIPEGVTSIGNYAFRSCNGFNEVINHATTPQLISANVFQYVTISGITLRVPEASVNLYSTTSVWEDFGSKAALIPVSSVSLNKKDVIIDVGATETLVATVAPSNATTQNFRWNSNNMAVATVDATGNVTGISGGTAIITATTYDGGKTATCEVKVIIPVTDITDVPTEAVAETPLELTGTVAPSDATYKNITWSVVNAGATGASILGGNTFNATTSGTATVRATIVNGTAIGTDYTQDFNVKVVVQFSLGSGAENDPYLITTATQLAQLAIYVNEGNTFYSAAHYQLGADIDLSGYQSGEGWIPIGQTDNNCPFLGVFDGAEHKITGLYINRASTTKAGLFGYTFINSTIKNLGVEDIFITSAGEYGVGGLVGYLGGSVLNCYTTGSVISTNVSTSYAGGIAGYSTGSVSYCYSTVFVIASSSGPFSYAGGLVGANPSGSVSNCYATGSVISNGTTSYGGGLVGYNGGSISDCVALNISLSCSGLYYGRITGVNSGGSLNNNIAFDRMLNPSGDTNWNNKGTANINGEDIDYETINTDMTLGGRFVDTDIWTTQNGKLPGLFGETVDIPVHLFPTFNGGGTTSNPYLITSAVELALLATYVNTGTSPYADAGVNYKLSDDIDLSAYQTGKGWTPIGLNAAYPFNGFFYGDNKKITSLTIAGDHLENAGLFGYVASGATVRSVSVEDVNIHATTATFTLYTGGVAGYNAGALLYCNSSGSVSSAVTGNDNSYTGGLAGYNTGSVTHCYSGAMVIASSVAYTANFYAGGLVGSNATGYSVLNCYTTGSVTVEGSYSFAGGVAGINYGSVSHCAALNTSINSNGTNTGRIVGTEAGTNGNNIAFKNMRNPAGNIFWDNKGLHEINGEDASSQFIHANATLGGRFIDTDGWATQNGKLPGFVTAVDMPAHLPFVPFAGNGTDDEPYIISTAAELAQFATYVNDGNTVFIDKHYLLGNDLDLSEYGENFNNGEGWIPIGWYVNPLNTQSFRGVFDGNHHQITGLYINNTTTYSGLFGYFGGTVKNLGVVDVNIHSNTISGAIVGTLIAGSISNCYATGVINVVSTSYAYAGGIVGNNQGSYPVTNCYSTVTVTASGTTTVCAGGIAGAIGYTVTVSNCYATGNVTAVASTGTAYAGGITGQNGNASYNPTLSNCFSTGSVSASGNVAYAGGIAGLTGRGSLSNCVALNPSISCTSAGQYFGRVAGSLNTGTLSNNVAFSQMINPSGVTTWKNVGANQLDGADYSAKEINEDGTLGGRFANTSIWTSENGKLPGLFGELVDMPGYLLFIAFSDGDGSESNPYIITTAEQLAQLAKVINAGNENYNGKHYKLGNDLDLSDFGENYNEGKGWIPIGNDSYFFNGVFDGDGHQVSGLYIDTDMGNVGLFGIIGYNHVVKNLGVQGAVTGNNQVGGVTGSSHGSISNCYAMVDVIGNNYVGGVAGGIMWSGSITGCYSTGKISGDAVIGGVAGGIWSGSITGCYSTGEVNGTSDVGGVAGRAYESYIANSYATGEVSGTYHCFGGIVGGLYQQSYVENCAALNPVIRSNSQAIGRIAGINEDSYLSKNIAWKGITVPALSYPNDGSSLDGADIETETIHADGTLGGRFTTGWKTQNGKLPGLHAPVEMPEYLYIPVGNSGNGESDDPYIITTPAQLAQLATAVNAGNADFNSKHYQLGNNIDLSNYQTGEGWLPIGISPESSFSGVFDGDKYQISNLVINNTSLEYAGLFGYVLSGTIKNLGVTDVNIQTSTSFISYTGAITGYSVQSDISNCYSTGSLTVSNSAHSVIGGLTGENWGAVSNCYSSATVSATGDGSYAGGVAGKNFGSVTRCYATGSISGTGYTGGIAGYNHGESESEGNVSDCAALNPNIKCTGDNFGRIVGLNSAGTLAGNAAFVLMMNPSNGTTWSAKGATQKDGDDISATSIDTNGTIGNRFTSVNGWTIQNGKLPGFGAAIDMPLHLQRRSGDASEPYLITTADQLAQLATLVNSGNPTFNSKHYMLGADIDLSAYRTTFNGGEGWIPIGNETNPFKGVFNGDNRVVSNLFINNTSSAYIGLFGYVSNGEVKKIGVVDVDIFSSTSVNTYLGAIVGFNAGGAISESYSSGSVFSMTSLNTYCGGITGVNSSGAIANCYSTASVYAEAGNGAYTGGVVGENSETGATVSNCYAMGWVSSNSFDGTAYSGGVAGNNLFVSITHCAAFNPRVTASGNTRAFGRVVGNNSGTLANNIAFDQMINTTGDTDWPTNALNAKDGEGRTIQAINNNDNGALSDRFKEENGWTTENRKLPGLFGQTVDMPSHLLIIDFSDGDGSQQNPYIITTAIQLAQLATVVNAGRTDYNDKYYQLGNNIDLSDFGKDFNNGEGWIPIGNIDDRFEGFFDGDNKKITGLYINSATLWYAGLFGCIENGAISNLGMEQVNITVSNSIGTGALCGSNFGSVIANCHSSGKLTSSNSYSGGLLGENFGTLSNSHSSVSITSEGYSYSGGLAGRNNLGATITNCHSSASITSNYYSGNITGINEGAITRCYSTGMVTSTGDTSVAGGITGINRNGAILNCYSTSSIFSHGQVSHAGGLVGSNEGGSVQNSAALNPYLTCSGNVMEFGRIVGWMQDGTLSNNAAFSGMINPNGNTAWNATGTDQKDGLSLSAQDINASGTIDGLFTTANGWTVQNGKLPGFGATIDMPFHLLFHEGTENDPYIITTPGQLEQLAIHVNAGNTAFNSKHYKLGADIDLSGYQTGEGWIPIGNNNHRFKGVFDGDKKKITGLYINSTSLESVGLFGCIENGAVKNLGIENANITFSYSGEPNLSAGILAGRNLNGDISNCYASGSIISSNDLDSSTPATVGGLLGENTGSLSHCYSTVAVTSNGFYAYAGGLVGSNEGAISNCAALNPSVNCSGDFTFFGRIAGQNNAGTLDDNIAFDLMINPDGETLWDNTILNGDDISSYDIYMDGTLGGRFKQPVWTTEEGKLPGLGAALAMAEHLKITLYTVTFLVAGENGSLTATVDGKDILSGVWVHEGKIAVFTAEPINSDYRVKEWMVNDVTEITSSTQRFVDVTENITVKIVFELIPPNDIKDAIITLSQDTYTYDGTEKKPGVTVVLNEETLIENTHYGVRYRNNTDAGTAYVDVEGINDYSGNVTKTFTINPATITNRAIKGVTIPEHDLPAPAVIEEDPQFTGTIQWSPDDNPFKPGTSYTAVITLSPMTNYTMTGVGADFFTVTGATASNSANNGIVTALFPATAQLQLTGTAIIDNTSPRIGETLTGSLDNSNNTGNLSYVWKAAGEKVGEGKEYIVTVGNFNKTITLEITSSVETGVRTSAETDAVLKKAAPSAPSAPVPYQVTHNSVTLQAENGYEYMNNTSSWQTSPTFGGLVSETKYTFYQRIKETDDTEASDTSDGYEVTTEITPSGALIGTAKIDNMNPYVGDKLTGSLVDGNNTGELSYVWKADGNQVGEGEEYTVTINDVGKSITLEITSSVESGSVASATPTAAVAIRTYTVTFHVAESGNGTLKATVDGTGITTGASIQGGKEVVFTASPDDNYRVKEWKLGGNIIPEATAAIYTHPGLSAAITVTVEFEPIPPTKHIVNFNVAGSGKGSLKATVNETEITTGDAVEEGEIVTFTAAPDNNYRIKEWKLDGNEISGITTTYTHPSLSAAITVTVEFEEIPETPPTITTTGLDNGTVDVAYSVTLTATGSDPIRWSRSAGNLPEGLNVIDYPGAISGTPKKAGDFTFVLMAKNNSGEVTKSFTITIAKGTGASLTGKPIMESKSHDRITVYEIASPENGQPVAYSIRRDLNIPPQTGWQSATTFTGLTPGALYYVFARAAENDDYLVGLAVESSPITTDGITNSGEIELTNLLKAWVRNEMLHIVGLSVGETLNVYNATGALIYQNVANSNEMDIPLKTQGVYLIQQGNHTVRVVIQ